MIDKWDKRFIELARHVSTWSKDPSTQTGAVIVDRNKQVISVGYNGLARGVLDTQERYENRELKYKIIVHCERNAIIFAQRNLTGCFLYTWPFMSCATCAPLVIQAGIIRCIAPRLPELLVDRWGQDCELAEDMFEEAGIQLSLYDMKEFET